MWLERENHVKTKVESSLIKGRGQKLSLFPQQSYTPDEEKATYFFKKWFKRMVDRFSARGTHCPIF